MTASLAPALAGPFAALAGGHGPGYGHHGGGFWLGPVFALFWILLIGLVVGLLRRSGRGPWGGSGGPGSAEAVLHERYARGEVDVEEYEARLEVLRRARKR
jgi:putative membrane protein